MSTVHVDCDELYTDTVQYEYCTCRLWWTVHRHRMVLTLYRMDTVQNGHCTAWTLYRKDTEQNGHCTAWTLYSMDTVQNGHCTEWTVYRMDTVQNGHCTKWTLYIMDTVQNGHCTEWTLYRMDTVQNGHCSETPHIISTVGYRQWWTVHRHRTEQTLYRPRRYWDTVQSVTMWLHECTVSIPYSTETLYRPRRNRDCGAYSLSLEMNISASGWMMGWVEWRLWKTTFPASFINRNGCIMKSIQKWQVV